MKILRLPLLIIVTVAVALTVIEAMAGTAAPAEATADLPSLAQAAGEELPVIQPAMACEALMQQDFRSLPDAATQVLSATLVLADNVTAEYCQVTGYIGPQIEFELRLPTNTWTGRSGYQQTCSWQGTKLVCH